MISIRDKQLKIFEEMTILEERIISKRLPCVINNLEFTSPSVGVMQYTNNNMNGNSLQQNEQRYRKSIQEYKRQYLMKILEEYEYNIEELEYLYQKELFRLEYDLLEEVEQKNTFICCLHDYLNHRTSQTIHEIRYKQARFRFKLAHPRHRRSSTKASGLKPISVYPEAIIETTAKNLFTEKELDFLSSKGSNQIVSLFIFMHPNILFHYM